MKYSSLSTILKGILVALIFCLSYSTPTPANQKKALDILLCLDLSSSTNGLLNDINSNFGFITKLVQMNYPDRKLRLGAIVYARPSFGSENNYVKILSPLTDHLNAIFDSLRALRLSVEEGKQFVGAVLEKANSKINWSIEKDAKKIIYLIGNGNVNSGADYTKTSEKAIKKDIVINTVYCTQRYVIFREIAGWKKIAEMTGGSYFTYKISGRQRVLPTVARATATLEMEKQRLDTSYLSFLKNNIQDFYSVLQVAGNTKDSGVVILSHLVKELMDTSQHNSQQSNAEDSRLYALRGKLIPYDSLPVENSLQNIFKTTLMAVR